MLLLFFFFCMYNFAFCEQYDNTIIILTLSPLLYKTPLSVPNEIGIYWNHPNFTEGDNLILYEGDATKNNATKLFTHKLPDSKGFVKTGRQASPPDGLYLHSAAIERNNKTLKVSPITNRMHWMGQLKSIIKNFTIPDLIIPGTHQSGSYYRRGIDGGPFDAKTITSKWSLCQDETIRVQLASGIRYLDIRPTAYGSGSSKEYVVCHGDIRMVTMKEIIVPLDTFLNTTDEIVVISFKEFKSGFQSSKDHEDFIDYLTKSLSHHIYPYNLTDRWHVPLERLWSSNKRLIIIYYGNRGNSVLWPGIPQFWCDTTSIALLYHCLNVLYWFEARPRQAYPHIGLPELTHNWKSIVNDVFTPGDDSLRAWGDLVGPYILKWYNEEWGLLANFVAVDFYQATGIVETAIYWNERRAKEPVLPHSWFGIIMED